MPSVKLTANGKTVILPTPSKVVFDTSLNNAVGLDKAVETEFPIETKLPVITVELSGSLFKKQPASFSII